MSSINLLGRHQAEANYKVERQKAASAFELYTNMSTKSELQGQHHAHRSLANVIDSPIKLKPFEIRPSWT